MPARRILYHRRRPAVAAPAHASRAAASTRPRQEAHMSQKRAILTLAVVYVVVVIGLLLEVQPGQLE